MPKFPIFSQESGELGIWIEKKSLFVWPGMHKIKLKG